MQKKAYSYIRFSTPQQLKGDSLRRQLEASRAYAKQHEVNSPALGCIHVMVIFFSRGLSLGRSVRNANRHLWALQPVILAWKAR